MLVTMAAKKRTHTMGRAPSTKRTGKNNGRPNRRSGKLPGDDRTWADVDDALREGLVKGVPAGTTLKDFTDRMERTKKLKEAVARLHDAEEEALRQVLDIEQSEAWKMGGHKTLRDYLAAEVDDRELKEALMKRAAKRVVAGVHDS